MTKSAIERFVEAIEEFDQYDGLPPAETSLVLIHNNCEWELTYQEDGKWKRLTLGDLRQLAKDVRANS